MNQANEQKERKGQFYFSLNELKASDLDELYNMVL